MMLQRLIKEPLLHFIVLGAALFMLFDSMNNQLGDAQEVLVSQARIEQLSYMFSKKWQRPPSAKELKNLVDDYVIEEIYYREAQALEIDKDDTVIRRRLRQKLEFLISDTATLNPPSDETLQQYLQLHAQQFETPPQYSFKQLYINPEKHAQPHVYSRQLKTQLQQGLAVNGDSTLLISDFNQQPEYVINKHLGLGFAKQLDKLALNQWQGPVLSSYGLHLILISQRIAASQPKLASIRQQVELSWQQQQQQEVKQRYHQRLLEKYPVSIEWPAAFKPSSTESKAATASVDRGNA